MRKIILTLLFITTGILISKAQDTAGIRFQKGLTWSQVLAKAKSEHKYIFVDCFATWCGPCKWMDANVYSKKEVGDAYNASFIAVRLQMDKTKADNDTVKSWYYTASQLEKNYSIRAYPTLIFFDPDGESVHKVAGSVDEKGFIRLANDAQDPDMQYYSILKNFQPGKLDTDEEKGLARSFQYSDKQLAGKLVLDYLTRAPRSHLQNKDNQDLMVQFEANPQVLNIAERYIGKLDKNEFGAEANLQFIARFSKDAKVQEMVKKYIDRLTEKQLYTKLNIELMGVFSTNPKDRGFNIFCHHANQVDSVMAEKGVAQGVAQRVIKNTEFEPLFDKAKETGIKPDFDAIENAITRKYNADYAERIIVTGKWAWYNYLIQTKKEDQYWPQLIDCRMAQVKRLGYDTLTTANSFCNNICYIEFFLHCNNKEQLNFAARWMRNVMDHDLSGPDSYNETDTYACLLYKAGRIDEAVQWEDNALQIATPKKSKKNIDYSASTIKKMKKGEAIWTEKEYQQ